jgi:hypothetical protein
MNYTRGAMLRGCAGILLLSSALACAPAAVPPRPAAREDHAAQRSAWFLRFRQSRDAQPPAAHLLAAWRQLRRLRVLRPRLRGSQRGALTQLGGNWTELGPRPETDPSYGAVAGRMTAIAVDTGKDPSGNTVYLGAADGGVWMSTNALAANPTFTPIGDNLPSLAIGAIALDDSTTPTTLYVGTGEGNGSQDSYYGLGIYKSTDGGATWTAGTGVDFFGSAIEKLLVDPASPNILLAAVTEGGVYVNNNLVNSTPAIGIVRSTDGGATWSQVAAFSGHSATDLVYDAGKYYAAVRSLGIYVSADQGQTWQALASPFGAVAPSAANFYRAALALRNGALFALIADNNGTPTQPSDCNGAAACAGLVESTDGGSTWSALALPANLYGSNKQGDYDQFLAAPASSALLVIGGIDVWSESLSPQPSGWTNLTNAYGAGTVHADQHAIAVLGPQTWIVANDGGAWSTANAGASWADMNASIGAIQFYSVTPDPATAGRLLGGSQDNGTVLGAAGSLSWSSIFGGDGGHTAINPQNPQQMFTENYKVSVQCSSDGGTSFTPVADTSLITEPTEFYVPYVLAPADPATMLLAGSSVWRGPACPATVNTGWQAISPALIHPNNANLTAKNDDLTALAAAPSSPDVIYAGAFDGSLSVTTNATVSGAQPTWTEAPAASPAAFAGPVTAIAVDPTNPRTVYWGMGFVGSSATLYKSTDGGQTAIDIAGNLPGTPINAIVLDPANPANVFVATDVGVFVVGDGGSAGANESWFRVGSNLPAAAVLSLALTDAGGTPTLIAGTHGRGAWSIPAVAPPGIALTAVPAQPAYLPGEPVTLNLAASGANGYQGSIALACGSPLPAGASCSISGTQALVTGIAQTGTVQVPIVATGNDNGTTLTQIVDADVNEGDFNLTASPATTTISAGGSTVYHVTLGGTADLSFPATVSCSGGPPAPGACSVASPITAARGGTFDVTVTTPPAAAASPRPPDFPGGLMGAWLLLLFAAGLVALSRRRARWAAVALLALASTACGNQGTQCAGCGTQNYAITIAVKDATPNTLSPLTRSVMVTLTVN